MSASLYLNQHLDKKKHPQVRHLSKNKVNQSRKNSDDLKRFSLRQPVFSSNKKVEFIGADTKQLERENTAQYKIIVHLNQQNKRLAQESKVAKQQVKDKDKEISDLKATTAKLQIAMQPPPMLSDVEQVKSLIEAQPDLITTNIKKQPDPEQTNKQGIDPNATSLNIKAPSKWDNLTGAVEFGFNYEQDNQLQKGLNGRLLMTYTDPLKYKLNSDFDFKYVNTDELATTNKARWQLQYDHNLTPVSTIFYRSDLNRSHFASYNKEYIYSVGYGRTIINTKKHNLLIEIGPGYRSSMPNIGEDSVRINEYIGRLNFSYQYVSSESLQFKFDSVTEIGHKNNIYLTNLQMQNKIYRKLFAVFEFEYKYTENVPEDTLRDEYSSDLTLLYAF
ncbi:MAG: DUF481 domain-containing protein [Psychromonas sp.]|nr:DUF481 domain-containing protein [Psychromonas sp.]